MEIESKSEKIIYVVVNPQSGSFDEATYLQIFDSIQNCILSSKKYAYTVVHLRTEYANHAKEVFHKMENTSNVALVIIIGGDGMIHEVVNGFHLNTSEYFPLFAICPNGSGNHLAKTTGTESFDKFMLALTQFIDNDNDNDKQVTHNIIPTCVSYTDKNNETQSSVLSINTIIGGIPAIINNTASKLSPYIPSLISPLKYEFATLINLFSKEYMTLELDDNQKLENVVALFIQTTKSCGNNFVIDDKISGNETELTYAYVSDLNPFWILFAFLKEKLGYRSQFLVRNLAGNSHFRIIACNDGSNTINVDGQSDPIYLPANVEKLNQKIMFLTV